MKCPRELMLLEILLIFLTSLNGQVKRKKYFLKENNRKQVIEEIEEEEDEDKSSNPERKIDHNVSTIETNMDKYSQ
jgi:hypothetical protein